MREPRRGAVLSGPCRDGDRGALSFRGVTKDADIRLQGLSIWRNHEEKYPSWLWNIGKGNL